MDPRVTSSGRVTIPNYNNPNFVAGREEFGN